MRAKFVNADGGWQYRNIPRLDYEIQFAIFPRLKWDFIDSGILLEARRRRFEYYGKNENGIPVYREIVE